MDMFDGFVFLEEKKKSLIPILCQYDFLSALTAPTFDYYENVKDFMTEEKWTGLGTPLLSMLAAESNEIVRSHLIFRYFT